MPDVLSSSPWVTTDEPCPSGHADCTADCGSCKGTGRRVTGRKPPPLSIHGYPDPATGQVPCGVHRDMLGPWTSGWSTDHDEVTCPACLRRLGAPAGTT
jgi:hypothetical protein